MSITSRCLHPFNLRCLPRASKSLQVTGASFRLPPSSDEALTNEPVHFITGSGSKFEPIGLCHCCGTRGQV